MNKKGFTLIELLAVILILGIIALIAIPAVNNVINDSKLGAERATINNIITAYENYYQLKTLKGETIVTNALTETSFQTNGEFDPQKAAEAIGITGDIDKTFTVFELDANGNAKVTYTVGSISCTNVNGTTVLAKGDCTSTSSNTNGD